MKKQITRVSLSQNAKMMAALYLAMSIPMAAVFAAYLATTGQTVVAVGVMVMIPLLYGLTVYLSALIGGWFYNIVAARVGGFEFTTKEVGAG